MDSKSEPSTFGTASQRTPCGPVVLNVLQAPDHNADPSSTALVGCAASLPDDKKLVHSILAKRIKGAAEGEVCIVKQKDIFAMLAKALENMLPPAGMQSRLFTGKMKPTPALEAIIEDFFLGKPQRNVRVDCTHIWKQAQMLC